MSEQNSVDPVLAAMEAARLAATSMLANQANQVAPSAAPANGGAVAVVRPGAPLTFEDMAAGSITVDQWIGVKEFGLLFGAEKKLVTEAVMVEIDLNAVAYQHSIKFGNPASYLKTYDGAVCASGGSWEAAIARAQRVDPNARPYPSADVPMRVLHDVKSGNAVVAEKGQVLGNSLSTTNWTNWKTFMAACKAAGLTGTVKVALTAEKRTNKNNNVWGVIVFTLASDA